MRLVFNKNSRRDIYFAKKRTRAAVITAIHAFQGFETPLDQYDIQDTIYTKNDIDVVWEAVHKTSGQAVAIKRVKTVVYKKLAKVHRVSEA